MTQKATFAAGCFWGVESAFRAIPGVSAVVGGAVVGFLVWRGVRAARGRLPMR